MEVGVKVEAENLLTGSRRHTNSCHVTYVAIDDRGRPIPVAGLIPETEEEKTRYTRAEERRRRRREESR
jgi:acyl-CoA hydrolase